MSEPFDSFDGTEGSAFDQAWCSKCQRDASYRRTGKGPSCAILLNILTGHGSDQWIRDKGGVRCLSFQKIKPKEIRKKKGKINRSQLNLF